MAHFLLSTIEDKKNFEESKFQRLQVSKILQLTTVIIWIYKKWLHMLKLSKMAFVVTSIVFLRSSHGLS